MNTKRLPILMSVLILSLGLATAALAAADFSQRAVSPTRDTGTQPVAPDMSQTSSTPPSALFPATSTRSPTGVPGDWDGGGVRYPMVIQDSGTYKMWYTGYELNGPQRIGYATSPDGFNWTKYGSNPVVGLDVPGEWDSDGLEASFVIKEGSASYKMWYSGFPDCAIGYATSSDGMNWTKYAGNPVLTSGGDFWNNNCVLHPSILFEGGVYKMWLLTQGDDGNGVAPYMAYATSPDGIVWTWHASNPLFGTTWENWLWRPDVLNLGGTYYMWHSVWDGEGRITYATSPDEVTWTKYGSPVLNGTPGEWDENTAIDPFMIENSGTYTMWYDNGYAVGIVTSTNGITWTKFLTGPVLLPGNPGIYMDANYAHDWIEAYTGPGETVLITLTSGANVYTITGQAGGDGWFRTYEWPWYPEFPGISPGDFVTATVAGGTTAVSPIGMVNGELDFDADTVFGTIEAPWFSPETLNVHCQVWVDNGPPEIIVEGVDPNRGNYFCDFGTVGWDMQPGQQIAVRYYEPDGDSVINIFEAPWMRVNYGHDWVGGNYDLGHTFWITVTDSGGTVKATADLDTWPGGGWGSDGFETQWSDWTPSQPDIQPYDWVYFQADDGYFNAMQVGEISGTVDVDNDSVSGPVFAPWFTETLYVECHPWGAPGPAPGKDSTAEPDGSAPYFCQWDPVTEWDIQPGQEIGVMYIESDLDRVIHPLHEPAPNMRVEKWAEGSGEAMPGGPVVYTIRYFNDGDATATTIYLTDTLPVSTTYLTDSSGILPTLGPGWVAWTLGPLEPGEWMQFQLVLTNTANPGDTLHNVLDVSTLYDFDYGNNHAEADAWVTDAQPDLYVNKQPVPGNPVPGQTMLWEIFYGNNSPVASGPVVLTDTLPFSSTVVSWFSDSDYGLWEDVSVSGDQLVLTAPTIPGYWGERIQLRVLVDSGVAVDTQLTNTVVTTTSNDTNPEDNWNLRNDVWTGTPSWDGYIDKSFNEGVLIPNGNVSYHIHARNNGNMASQTWITETLPTGTIFDEAWLSVGPYRYPFPPDYLDGQIAVWDVGILEPGQFIDLDIYLSIENTTPPGTVLTNCAEIALDADPNWPYDPNQNVDCVISTVNDPGPNLQIEKTYYWNWEGQLHYDIRISNIGTTTEYSVAVTDTLPMGTEFNGNWWQGWSPDEVQFTDLGSQLVWTLNLIQPAWNWHLSFEVDLDGNLIGEPGLAYTNTIEVPISGDVDPGDNQDTVTAVTGPDIYVNKWLSGGIPRPGEIVTFTIEFGNQNIWPWHTYGPTTITDVFPAEMTFITATAPWDPNQSWTPIILPNNSLIWGWGDICSECWWQFDLVVQITDTVEAWDVLPNVVEMFSQGPYDLEWDYGNNTATTIVSILNPQFAISKDYTTTEIAGMPVTYTLRITNTGNWDDTGLAVTDLLPDYMTYTNGGDYDPGTGLISWNVNALAHGESAEVVFSGVLACTAGVTVMNDTYQVAGSDEGISSPFGDPVSFDILAPTLVAAFDQSANSIIPGKPVTFTSTSTTNGKPIVSWVWDFGDGSTATGATTSHAYTIPGIYTVTLTITDACGFTETLVVNEAVTVVQTMFEVFLPVIVKE